MLPNQIDVSIGGSTHHYSLSSLADAKSVRRDITETNLSLPGALTVAHSSSGKGDKAIDSYLLRLDRTVATSVDASSNIQAAQTLSAYMVVKVPRGIANSKTAAYQMAMALASFCEGYLPDDAVNRLWNRILSGEL